MHWMLRPLLLLLAGLAPGVGRAGTEPADEPRYVLGAALSDHAAYTGSIERKTSLTPTWALQWGKWRLTGPNGAGLLGFGRENVGQGASREFVRTPRWRAGVTLRIDGGRSSGEASTTRGLPDVRRSLRARFYASYHLGADWDASAAVSPDLLGRGGGLLVSAGLGWRIFRSPITEWTAGAGVNWADRRYQQSYFGVDAAHAAEGRPAYLPGAGWRDLGLGTGFTHRLSPHAFVFGSGGVNHLMGPTGQSPLVQRRNDLGLSLGLAWRN